MSLTRSLASAAVAVALLSGLCASGARAGGSFGGYVIINNANINGGNNAFYDTDQATGNPDFINGFSLSAGSFRLGGQMTTWPGGGGADGFDFAQLRYNLDGAGFVNLNLPFARNVNANNDDQWEQLPAGGVQLGNRLNRGAHTLAVYFFAQDNNGASGTTQIGSSGSPYTANFFLPTGTYTWDSGGGDDNLTTPNNWSGDLAPGNGHNLSFGSGARTTPTLDVNYSVEQITFTSGAPSYTIGRTGSATLLLSTGISNNSNVAQHINVPITLASSVIFGPSTGPLVFENTISTGSNIIHWSGSDSGTLAGVVSGNSAGGIFKTGSGALIMPAGVTHTYAGETRIDQGLLRVEGTLAAGGGSVSVAKTNPNSGVLGGSGTIARAVHIFANGAISPGSNVAGEATTIGNLTVSGNPLTLNGGGAYVVELNRRADQGAEGVNWDKLTLSSLTVSATPANKFVIKLMSLTSGHVAGALQGWDPQQIQEWRIATVSGAVSGFDPAAFDVDTAAFASHNSVLGSFSVWRDTSDGSIRLRYVPEPSSSAAVLIGGAAALLRRRRPGSRSR